MKLLSFSKLLIQYADRYSYMEKRCPIASKKRRTMKKWRRKYGPPLSELILNENFFLKHVKSQTAWAAGALHIPITAEY